MDNNILRLLESKQQDSMDLALQLIIGQDDRFKGCQEYGTRFDSILFSNGVMFIVFNEGLDDFDYLISQDITIDMEIEVLTTMDPGGFNSLKCFDKVLYYKQGSFKEQYSIQSMSVGRFSYAQTTKFLFSNNIPF